MQKKKLFILIILFLALAFLFLFSKKDINKNNLELCSNKYLTTEYSKDGKIVIKDWPWNESDEDYNSMYENLSPEAKGYNSRFPFSDFLSFDYIKDLTCVQRIELYGGTNYRIPWSENENIEKLASLVNLEELYINMERVPNGDINELFNYLKNLKKISITMGGPTLSSFQNMENLKNLEELEFELQNANVRSFDFEKLPVSIKKLKI
jgi:hypothetical protein